MKISIIIPVYNGEKYLQNLIEQIRKQKIEGNEVEIIAAVSKSSDKSMEISKKICDIAYHVDKFNHAKTRHEAALKSNGEIIVFITQDMLPVDEYWLINLINPLFKEKTIAGTFSRQVPYKNATRIERIMRNFNYPEESRKTSKDTESIYGRKNYYFSDVSSAMWKEIFIKLGGYDFDIPTAEDSVYAKKAIDGGYEIFYSAESKVYHSHNFSLKENYDRYFLLGQTEGGFFKSVKKSEGEGIKLLKHLTKKLLKEFALFDLLIVPIDFFVRYKGYKDGVRSLIE